MGLYAKDYDFEQDGKKEARQMNVRIPPRKTAKENAALDAGIDVRRTFEKNSANRFEVRMQEGDKQVICK